MLELVLQGALVTAAGEIPAAPVIGVMAFGLVMAMVGHAARRTALVATGIAVLLLATAAMVLFAYLDYRAGDSFDPRPRDPSLPSEVYQ